MICPFFGSCGGCAYQNLTKEEYRKLKEGFIQNALSREGISFSIDQMIDIGLHTRRRATFACVNKHFGFNANKSHQIVEITQCPVLRPELEKLIDPLRNLCSAFAFNTDVAVFITQYGADISVNEIKHPVKRSAKHKKKRQDDLLLLETVTCFCRQNNVARFVYNDNLLYQATQLPFPPNVFMQPSDEGEKILIDLVIQGCQESNKIVDLFCGLGTFTKPLHAVGKKVKGYDITTESIEMLKKAGFDAEVRDLFRQPLTPNELNDFDCAVLDPARAGAAAQVSQIADSNLKNVVMVSCNPITFARDCKTLINSGFEFEKITPVDQFTYTQHIEVVAILKRK